MCWRTCKLTTKRVVRTKNRLDFGANCPIQSMVRKSYGGIIGDVPMGTIPFGRVATVSDFLRRRADTAMVGGDDDYTPEERKAGGQDRRRGRSVCPRSCPR